MQGKRIPRYPSAVLFYLSTVETSAQTGATFRAPAIFEFFDTLRMMTTTLDELNDDGLGISHLRLLDESDIHPKGRKSSSAAISDFEAHWTILDGVGEAT